MSVPGLSLAPTFSGCQTLLPVEYLALPLIWMTLALPSMGVWALKVINMAMATPDATRPLMKLRFFIIFAPAQLTALLLREFRFLDALVNEYYSAKICQAPFWQSLPTLSRNTLLYPVLINTLL